MSRRSWMAGPGRAVSGESGVPGDKSVSHRAIMLAALAEGRSRIHGFLEGEDTLATAAAFSAMGVSISEPAAGIREVTGVGLHGLAPPPQPLDCGNAGTAMRLLAGLLAPQAFDSTLVGDASLSARPMARVVTPLAQMGARIETADGGRPPLRIHASNGLQGIDFEVPVASAQLKSAVLLAGLYASGSTTVREPRPTRDYTERMLARFGWPLVIDASGAIRIESGHRLQACELHVPGDFSSAAFLIVAACLVPGSDLWLRGVGVHPRRTGLLRALQAMGADIVVQPLAGSDDEPLADLHVRHARLRGIELPESWVADMIDEFPALFVAAAAAAGETVVRGAAELRVKESDRIAGMASGLRALGIGIEERPDGAAIRGGRFSGGSVEALGDHRLAMAFAVAAQLASGPVEIAGVEAVDTSFPGFMELARGLGFAIEARIPA